MMIGPLEFNVFYSSLPGPRAGAGDTPGRRVVTVTSSSSWMGRRVGGRGPRGYPARAV